MRVHNSAMFGGPCSPLLVSSQDGRLFDRAASNDAARPSLHDNETTAPEPPGDPVPAAVLPC